MEFGKEIWQLEIKLKGISQSKDGFEDVSGNVAALRPLFSRFEAGAPAMVFYLVLISDHGVDLSNDLTVGFLLKSACRLKMRWVVQILGALSLQHHLLDVIRYGPFGVSSVLIRTLMQSSKEEDLGLSLCEIAQATLGKTKLIFPNKSRGIVYNRLTCCNETCYNNGNTQFYIHSSFNELVDAITETLSEVAAKGSKSESEGEKFGRIFCNFLEVVEDSIEMKSAPDAEKVTFYQVENEYTNEGSDHPKAPSIWMLPKLEGIMDLVSCDVWIGWEEHIFGSRSLQRAIGNKIYSINCKIKTDWTVPWKVKQSFLHLQIQPTTEDDEVACASLEEIVVKITRGESAMMWKWYAALLAKEEAWLSPDLIQVILDYLDLADNSREVLFKCVSYIYANPNLDEVKQLFLVKLKNNLTVTEILKAVCSSQFQELFSSAECCADLTVAFNKFSKDATVQDFITEIIVFAIQWPAKVLDLIFKLATSSGENHAACLEMLTSLNPVFVMKKFLDLHGMEVSGESLFNYVVEQNLRDAHTDKEGLNLVKFLGKIVTSDAITFPTSFVPSCLVKIWQEKLATEDWRTGKLVLMALKEVVSLLVDEPFIAMTFLSQVSLTTSWDAGSYAGPKAELNQLCCEIISDLKPFVAEASDTEKEWMRRMVTVLPETVRTHFFWLNATSDIPDEQEMYVSLLASVRAQCPEIQENSVKVILECKGLNFERSLTLALVKVLPVLHSSEWPLLFTKCCELLAKPDQLSSAGPVFKVFSDAMCIFSTCADSKTFGCFEFCMNNFTELFNSVHLSEKLTAADHIDLFKNVLKPLDTVNCEKVRNNCYFLILPVLFKVVKIAQNGATARENLYTPLLNSVNSKWRDLFQNALGNNVETFNAGDSDVWQAVNF